MDVATIAGVFGGVALLLGNAFFVVTEFALTRVRQFSEEEFEKTPGLERAWEMTDRLEIYLSGCQVGITICSVGLGVVAEPALAALLEPLVRAVGLGTVSVHTVAIIVALVVINLLHVIVGEQAPTYLGIERTKTIARYLAPALYWWTRVLAPVIYLADWAAKRLLGLGGVTITRSWTEEGEGEEEGTGPMTERMTSLSEVRQEMGQMLKRGDLSDERRDEVISALEIDRLPVREIMIPAERIVALRAGDSFEKNWACMQEHPFDRYPLVGDSLHDRRGTVYTTMVLRDLEALSSGRRSLAEEARDPMSVPADLAVSDLIDRFQDEDQELAVVTDAQGETVGVVTTTDAFEAIAGELEDPVDKGRAAGENDAAERTSAAKSVPAE